VVELGDAGLERLLTDIAGLTGPTDELLAACAAGVGTALPTAFSKADVSGFFAGVVGVTAAACAVAAWRRSMACGVGGAMGAEGAAWAGMACAALAETLDAVAIGTTCAARFFAAAASAGLTAAAAAVAF
jgi:hypothetical protein